MWYQPQYHRASTLPYWLQLRWLWVCSSLDYCKVYPNIFILFSICAKLQNADLWFDFTSSYFLWCLYEGESRDPNSPDIGFLKGPLLICVSTSCRISLSEDWNRLRHIIIYLQLLPQPPERMHLNIILGVVMLLQVFIWMAMSHYNQLYILQHRYVILLLVSITILLRHFLFKLIFSLNSAWEWKHEHTGFYYPSFYNFVLDFLEDVKNNISTATISELLQWWNRCVLWPSLPETWRSNCLITVKYF